MKSFEPRHEKTWLRVFPTRSDSNWPAQPQKLARVLKFRLKNLEILFYLCKQRTTKALIRLRGCAGWSAPLLFAYDIRLLFSWPGSFRLSLSIAFEKGKWYCRPKFTFHRRFSCFYIAPQKMAGYYVIPSEPFECVSDACVSASFPDSSLSRFFFFLFFSFTDFSSNFVWTLISGRSGLGLQMG